MQATSSQRAQQYPLTVTATRGHAELRSNAEEQLCFYLRSTNPITTTDPIAATQTDQAGGALFTITSDPVAAASAKLAGDARFTTTKTLAVSSQVQVYSWASPLRALQPPSTLGKVCFLH